MKIDTAKLTGAGLIILIIVLIASAPGCAAAPAGAPAPAPDSTVTSAAADAATEEKEAVAYKVPVLLRESRFLENDLIDMRKENQYVDESDTLLSSVTYDRAGKVFETVKTEQEELTTLFLHYDRENNLLKQKKETVDSSGNIIESVLSDARGSQISRSVYKYDNNGLRSRWEIYDSSDTMLAYNVYKYEDTMNIRTESFSPSGVLEEYFVSDFDSDGNKTQTSHYDKNGSTRGKTVYSYADSQLLNEKRFSGEKTLLNEINYSYTENRGNLIEKSTITGMDGTVVEIIEKEYFFIEKERR